MLKAQEQSFAFPDGQVLLTTVAAISYFLFLYLLIHTAVTLDGACLYTFWLPYRDQWFSPYWLTVALVSGLVVWAMFGLTLHCRIGAKSKWSIVYYMVATVVLGWWLYDLWGFWNAMQYERGLLTVEQYYGELAITQLVEPHECTGI